MSTGHVSFTSWEGRLRFVPGDPVLHRDPHRPGTADASDASVTSVTSVTSMAPTASTRPSAPTEAAVRYRSQSWESPVVECTFPARELISSWNARTPGRSWLTVEARVEIAGEWTPWLTLARWCEEDPEAGGAITRSTARGQSAGPVRVATDTVDSSEPFARWQLRVVALRADDDDPWPSVTLVGAVVSAFGDDHDPRSPWRGAGVEVDVPPLSQRRHVDTFPQWDNGGQSWCSATSTAMVLHRWGLAPTATETAWVGSRPDPEVVDVVRHVFDADYGGAGNWSFNVAYAATRGLRAHVTRLRDLGEAETFLTAGIPLVVSVAFRRDELDGAGYDTNGHLLTIVGFTPDGDVICNDPNSHRIPSNDEVRVVFDRAQFERVWAGGRGGLTYLMHPADHPLPPAPAEANW